MAYSKGITLTDLLAALRSDPPARRGPNHLAASPEGSMERHLLSSLLPQGQASIPGPGRGIPRSRRHRPGVYLPHQVRKRA